MAVNIVFRLVLRRFHDSMKALQSGKNHRKLDDWRCCACGTYIVYGPATAWAYFVGCTYWLARR
jgi:hypothetical protein